MIDKKTKFLSLAALFYLSCSPFEAQAAGFYLQEQSVRGQGTAFAGAAANPEDASTIFFNPAGITALENAQTVAGLSLIMPQAKFSNNGSTAALTPAPQAVYGSTSTGGNPFSPTAVPNFYVALPFHGKKYWIGLGVTSPFGLKNEYAPGWFGRYDSTKSDLRIIDIAPVLAAQITNRLSIGGGPNIQYADALLENALPCPAGFLACGAPFSPTSDGISRLEGDTWDVGYNIGIRWDMDAKTRFGAHYRSAITHNIPGLATVSGLGGGLGGNNGVRDAHAKLKLPDVIGLGVSHDVNNRLKLLGSYNHFGWSNFDAIPVTFDNGTPAIITPQDYKDSFSVALGAEWKQSEKMTFRGGLQYDETPTTDSGRSTRTPDGNRYWLSLGMTYKATDSLTLDAAATHIFMGNGDINLAKRFYAGTAVDSTVHVRGTSDNSLDILSLQAALHF